MRNWPAWWNIRRLHAHLNISQRAHRSVLSEFRELIHQAAYSGAEIVVGIILHTIYVQYRTGSHLALAYSRESKDCEFRMRALSTHDHCLTNLNNLDLRPVLYRFQNSFFVR